MPNQGLTPRLVFPINCHCLHAISRGIVAALMLCLVGTLVNPDSVRAHANPPLAMSELASKIEVVEKKQGQLEKELQLAAKVDEAKWDLLKLVLLLLLGGGGAVFFALLQMLRPMLERDAGRLGDNLSKRLQSELDGMLGQEMISSEVRRLSSHAYIYGDIAEAYTPSSPQWTKYLKSAVDMNEDALVELEKLPEDHPKKKRRRCVIKSNLAFSLALLGDPDLREKAMEHSKYVQENAAEFLEGYHWEDTYGWVLLVFARNQDERLEAVNRLEALYNREDVPQGWATKRKGKLLEFTGRN